MITATAAQIIKTKLAQSRYSAVFRCFLNSTEASDREAAAPLLPEPGAKSPVSLDDLTGGLLLIRAGDPVDPELL